MALILGFFCFAMVHCDESDDDGLITLDHPAESTLQWEKRGPDIEEISHEPSNFSLCPDVYDFSTFPNLETWGWTRAEINSDTTYGIAYLVKNNSTETENDFVLIADFINFDNCVGQWQLGIQDMYWPTTEREEYPHKALLYNCEYIDNRVRRVWTETPGRVANLSLLDHDAPLQNYHPDTLTGSRLRYVLDQVDTVRKIAVGRFVGRFYADPSCPVNVPEQREVTIERGYFQANILTN